MSSSSAKLTGRPSKANERAKPPPAPFDAKACSGDSAYMDLPLASCVVMYRLFGRRAEPEPGTGAIISRMCEIYLGRASLGDCLMLVALLSAVGDRLAESSSQSIRTILRAYLGIYILMA